MNFIHWYSRMLKEKPYTTKSITSFITFGLGDLLCQKVEERLSQSKTSKPIDIKRIIRQGSFGVFITPYLHIQYSVIMPKIFCNPGAMNIAKMLLYDQTVNAAAFIFCFFMYMDFISKSNYNFNDSLKDTFTKFPSTLLANWKLWPAAQLINFTVVPIDYRVFFINIVAIFWNTYLSYVQNVLSVKKPEH